MKNDFFQFTHEVSDVEFKVRTFRATDETDTKAFLWYAAMPDTDEWLPLCITNTLDAEDLALVKKELELSYLPQLIAYLGLTWAAVSNPDEARADFIVQKLWKSSMSVKDIETLRECSVKDIRVLRNAENSAFDTKGTGDLSS